MNTRKSAAGSGDKKIKSASRVPHGKLAPKLLFILILLLYFTTTYFVTVTSRSQDVVMIMGMPVPVTSFTGVLSSLSNICIIILVVLFHKVGYITSLIILLSQTPLWAINTIVRRNLGSLPGIFSSLFTILAITIIYMNNRKITRYQKRLRDQAMKDTLTQLPNRFACTELMDSLIRRNERFALVSIDLNNFKSINDTMGHEIGNRILIEIGSRWQALADSWKTGTRDFVAHLSGDEYALLIRGCRTETDILRTIQAYEAELESKFTIDDCDYFITASFGFSVFPNDANFTGALFSSADAALHEVKRLRSSNHILHYTPRLLSTEHDLEVERKIRAALDTDSLLYYLQPQYDINHNLRGFEALARIRDVDDTIIPPADFIPVAEKADLIDRIDMTVLKKAAEFLGKRIKNPDTDITLSINISVKHLMKNNFIDELKEILRSCGLRSDHLELEITESVMIDSAEKALRRIEEVKSLGMKIAIDDFGTGFSSLSYLSSFPANLLKIDKSFIDVMNTSESSKQYVATIISIGHIMNLQVISEGVETEEQLETLRSINCDLIQGYVWGRPMMPEVAAKLLPLDA